MMSSRDPYPFPRLQNDDNFAGSHPYELTMYTEPVHGAQQQDPWNRLNKSGTLSSARHEVFHFDPQAPRDYLDFTLKSQYDHHGEIFRDSNETLVQPETLGMKHGRILKNRVVEVPAPKLPLNHPLTCSGQKKKENINSVNNAIAGHHTQTTNRGYSRKPDGGFFTT